MQMKLHISSPASLLAYLGLMAPYLLARVILRCFQGGADSRRSLSSFFGWRTLLDYLLWLRAKIGVPLILLLKFTVGRPYFHERRVSRLIRASRGRLFVDLGAHLGHYTLLAAGNYDCVMAVEPHHAYAHLLDELVRFSCPNGSVKVVECAIGETDGYTELYFHERSGSISIYDQTVTYTPTFEERHHRQIGRTRVLRFQTLLDGLEADLVKVDIEGAEWTLLNPETVGRSMSWVIECHDLSRLEEMIQCFHQSGFTTIMLDDYHIYAWRSKAQ